MLFFHTKLLYFLSVFIIRIENVFNRCPNLPVVFTGFFENCQCFHERLHNFSADIWYTQCTIQLTTNTASRGRSSQTASKSSHHMVEQKAFYAVIFLHVFNSMFTYIQILYVVVQSFSRKILLICLFTLIVNISISST